MWQVVLNSFPECGIGEQHAGISCLLQLFAPPAIRVVPAFTLPDLSGLAWVEDDLFIGIHDARDRSAQGCHAWALRYATARTDR